MNNLFSFTGQGTPLNDPVGMQQYAQQGQAQINPGQAQVAASNPIASAGRMNLASALQQAPQPTLPAQMPMPQAQAGLQGGAMMGQPGPTPQALALADGLRPQAMINPTQQFMKGQ